MTNSEDLLQCQLCDKTSMGSLISHIIKKHKIEMKEYRSRFPNVCVQRASAAQRAKNSQIMKEKLKDPTALENFLTWRSFPSEIKHWIKKGYNFSEAKQKVSEYQRIQSLKGNNEKTRQLRSTKNSGAKNPMSIESISARENVSIHAAHMLTPCFGRTGNKHPMYGKKHTKEALQKIASSPHLSNPSYRSIPERELEEECLLFAPTLRHNANIERWNVDILIDEKRLIIELFGDWWHMNPQKYKADDIHKLTKKTASQIWDRDTRKIDYLQTLGYHVEIIWELDWRLDKEACIERVKNAYYRIL